MYSLGLDIGSSSVKAAIVDIKNSKLKSSTKYPESEMPIKSPQKNWAEQEPMDWWKYTLEAIKQAIKISGISGSEIKSIGISYQMHGLVCIDKEGLPLRPSIIWCDSRAIECGEELSHKLPNEIIKQNLFNKPSNFTASKLLWVKKNEPHIYDKIYKIMLPGDFIAFKMSNEVNSTYSGLSEGIFFDFKNYTLSKELISAAEFDKEIFPDCGSCFEVLSKTNEEFEKLVGIKKGTPISYRAGDQPNNAFSLGVINNGEVAATGGTSGVVYAVSKQVNYDEASRVNSFAHVNHTKSDPKIGTLLCINGTGILYNWIRTNNFENVSYNELEKYAESISIGSDGVSILPFGNGAERMLGNRVIDASIHGLDFNRHSKFNVLRAGLEGIAFAFFYGMQAMKELGIDVGNIKAGNDNLFQSKIFSKTLSNLSQSTIQVMETTGAIGAANGAALGAGHYSTIEESISNIQIVETIAPEQGVDQYVDAYERWKDNLNKIINKN